MSFNINEICRVCLIPTTNRNHANLFFPPGRSNQLRTKIMACAWVQVFEGDGLPCQLCSKCCDKLDIAYEFKQQCETADTQLRQFLGRDVSAKAPQHNIEIDQRANTKLQSLPKISRPVLTYTGYSPRAIKWHSEQRECLLDCKPINFNISNERVELPQCDLTLSALRLLNQDLPFIQNIDLRIADDFLCTAKQEPDFSLSTNILSNVTNKNDANNLNFKCESLAEGIFNNIQSKILEAVTETIPVASSCFENPDDKMIVWDLQNKQPTLFNIPEKTIDEITKTIPIEPDKALMKGVERDNTSLSFLDDEDRLTPLDDNVNSAFLQSQFENVNCNKVVCLKVQTPPALGNIDIGKGTPLECTTEETKQVETKSESRPTKDKCKIKKVNKIEVNEQCELCGKIFKYRGYMQQHLRTHTDQKPFKCEICNQTFSMHHSLVTHRRSHSGDKPFICAQCGKGFTQSSGLKSHMRLHSGERPYKCDLCLKSFAQSSNLISHKLTHSGERQHVCKICKKAFKCHKHLQGHQKLHSEQKEFKCSVCPKSFYRKSYLKTHLSIHSGLKKFKCEECGHVFGSSSNLNTHMRVHNGVKPFTCQICKKNFTKSNALTRHVQQQHNII